MEPDSLSCDRKRDKWFKLKHMKFYLVSTRQYILLYRWSKREIACQSSCGTGILWSSQWLAGHGPGQPTVSIPASGEKGEVDDLKRSIPRFCDSV